MLNLVDNRSPRAVIYVAGKDPIDVEKQLAKIPTGYVVLGAYGMNGVHYVVIETDARKITNNKKGA